MTRKKKISPDRASIFINVNNKKLLQEIMQHPDQHQKIFVGLQTLDQSLKDADRSQNAHW